jgi:hypothetical protein
MTTQNSSSKGSTITMAYHGHIMTWNIPT